MKGLGQKFLAVGGLTFQVSGCEEEPEFNLQKLVGTKPVSRSLLRGRVLRGESPEAVC